VDYLKALEELCQNIELDSYYFHHWGLDEKDSGVRCLNLYTRNPSFNKPDVDLFTLVKPLTDEELLFLKMSYPNSTILTPKEMWDKIQEIIKDEVN